MSWSVAWQKYSRVLVIGIQNTLVYRANFLFRASISLVPLLGTLQVWRTIYAGKADGGTIAGYTLSGMISYYLIVNVVDALTAVTDDDWEIAADIRDGKISQFLLRPIDYLTYRLCLYLSGRAIYTSVALIPVILFTLYLRHDFRWPTQPITFLLFPLSVLMGGLIQFFIAYLMALLAFWFLDVSTLIFIQFAFEYIASGHLFPLDLLPAGLQMAIFLTPYPYLSYFPASVYLENDSGVHLALGFAVQTAWLVIGYVAARWAWSRGLRRYTSVGG
jgi:ABC-2 type transport system permease protein